VGPPDRDGRIRVLLSRLPEKRAEGIIAEQMMLPAETSVDERLVRLLHACPTLHKLGQVVGHDRHLDPTHYVLPAFDYRETLDSVRRLLLNETRLDIEQTHLAKAARFYAAFPAIRVPQLLPFCTQSRSRRAAPARRDDHRSADG
jgi:hypothetical protein